MLIYVYTTAGLGLSLYAPSSFMTLPFTTRQALGRQGMEEEGGKRKAQRGAVRRGTARRGAARRGEAWHGTARPGTARHSKTTGISGGDRRETAGRPQRLRRPQGDLCCPVVKYIYRPATNICVVNSRLVHVVIAF